ncbi:hypothetical protein CJD44_07785 [Streptomyces sp. alain-838]|nr:hypothetical protein CJD44_07785 [Streptomyces sp. alain-838]
MSGNPLMPRQALTVAWISLGEKAGSYQHAGGVQLLSADERFPVLPVLGVPLTVVRTFVSTVMFLPCRFPLELPRLLPSSVLPPA